MHKFCKNLKIGLTYLIPSIILWIILLILSIVFPDYFIALGTLILVSLIVFPFCLFLDPFGVLYFISFNEYGINLYFCKKLIKNYKWSKVEKVRVCVPFLSGKNFEFILKNNKTMFVTKSKKIEAEIKKYVNIEK